MERTFQKTGSKPEATGWGMRDRTRHTGGQLVQWSSHECNFSGRLSWKEVIAVGVLQDCFVDNTHACRHYSDSENSLRNAIKMLTGKQPERVSSTDRCLPWRKLSVRQCVSALVPKLKCKSKKWHLQRCTLSEMLDCLWTRLAWHLSTPVREVSLAWQMAGEDVGQSWSLGFLLISSQQFQSCLPTFYFWLVWGWLLCGSFRSWGNKGRVSP